MCICHVQQLLNDPKTDREHAEPAGGKGTKINNELLQRLLEEEDDDDDEDNCGVDAVSEAADADVFSGKRIENKEVEPKPASVHHRDGGGSIELELAMGFTSTPQAVSASCNKYQ